MSSHEGRVELGAGLRAVIIGYGHAGAIFHAPLVASTPGITVAAVVTSNTDRRERVRRNFPEAMTFDSADEIWRRPDRFDLVVVATPNRFHAPLAIAAMRRGLPVVVDKPMALSEVEADELIMISEETGVPLTCFQNRRWDGDFLTVQRLLKDGDLGTIVRFESRFERYRPAVRPNAWREQTTFDAGGGLLWDLGSHLIDQALVLFGEPVAIYAEMGCRRPGAITDDDTFVALTFAGGVHGHLGMTYLAPVPGPRFRLNGLEGTYTKYGLDPQEDALRAGAWPASDDWGIEDPDAWGRLRTHTDSETVDRTVETVPGSYPSFYAAVRDALLGNGPMPVDPHDAARTIRVIEVARRSAVRNSSECMRPE